MAKQATLKTRDSRKKTRVAEGSASQMPPDDWIVNHAVQRLDFKCKTEAQKNYLNAIRSKRITFGVGPAGTGKTFVAVSQFAKQLRDRSVSRLVFMRPAVTAEEDVGFLPGELEEKIEPFFTPIREILEEWFGRSAVDNMLRRKTVEVASLGHARGRTFANALVLLDEAQNTTAKQMKLFLTRLGEGSTFVINGDTDQCDINERSGLDDAITRMRDLPDSQICFFEDKDSVRDPLLVEILKRYRH